MEKSVSTHTASSSSVEHVVEATAKRRQFLVTSVTPTFQSSVDGGQTAALGCFINSFIGMSKNNCCNKEEQNKKEKKAK